MKTLSVTILILICVEFSSAQTFSFVPHDTTMVFTPLTDITYKAPIVNISNAPINVFVVRTVNNIPGSWYSSLCFGQNCFAFFIDSVASTTDFGEGPIAPGDTLDFSLHIFSDTLINDATVTLKIGNLANPDESIVQTFHVTQSPTTVDDDELIADDFVLYQNYPNPFNPTTKIKFSVPTSPLTPLLKERGRGEVITLKVFDILGNEVATLVNEVKEPGVYEVEFPNNVETRRSVSLLSGVYFYQLRVGLSVETRKMILLR